MPIFAYMIAEGCMYTKSKRKYVLLVGLVGIICQMAVYVTLQSLAQYILITFTLSIILIYLLQFIWEKLRKGRFLWLSAMIAAVAAVYVISDILPGVIPCWFQIEYGFWGVMLPVLIYVPELFAEGTFKRILKLLFAAVGLVMVALRGNPVTYQWFSLAALILLLFYNGRRGRLRLKYLFYVYYPVHMAICYWIGTLVR